MNVSVVGHRDGKPVIRWPGVVFSIIFISGIYSLPIAGCYWGVDFFDARSFALLPVLLLGILGTVIFRGLKRPAADSPAVA